MANNNIFVAGHTGLVGSAICRRLAREKDAAVVTVPSSELDLRRQKETEDFFNSRKLDQVFLAAAKVGGILANSTYKAEFIYDNLAISMNVINSAYRSGVKKLLNLGSSCIYPKLAPQPMAEASLLTSPLEPTNEPYAVAKIAALKLCRYYNEQYGTDYISLMPTNLYGPNDNYNLETAHVLPAMLRKFHLAKLLRAGDYAGIAADVAKRKVGFGLDGKVNWNEKSQAEAALAGLGLSGQAVTLWGTGEVYREFLYSDDLADACVFLMRNKSAAEIGEIVNIGTGQDQKLKDLALEIRQVVGFEGEIRYDSSRPDGTPRKLQDVSRILKLGWQPKTGMPEGLRLAYQSYLA